METEDNETELSLMGLSSETPGQGGGCTTLHCPMGRKFAIQLSPEVGDLPFE